jgi:hypothetical protein
MNSAGRRGCEWQSCLPGANHSGRELRRGTCHRKGAAFQAKRTSITRLMLAWLLISAIVADRVLQTQERSSVIRNLAAGTSAGGQIAVAALRSSPAGRCHCSATRPRSASGVAWRPAPSGQHSTADPGYYERPGTSLTVRTTQVFPRSSSWLKHPSSWGSAPGSPKPGSNTASTWRLTASWLAVPPRQRRAMSVRPATARSRTADVVSTPGASSTEPQRAITFCLLTPVRVCNPGR